MKKKKLDEGEKNGLTAARAVTYGGARDEIVGGICLFTGVAT